MNGRVYDAELGRFLSPDIVIQDASNLQALNAYSYVLNNPLSLLVEASMHPLLAMLASWPGRQATKSRLEREGYWLPERFREIVVANSGDCDLTGLDRYWDEVAREYFCSAGKANSNRRLLGETSYRSAYLDALALQPENREAVAAGLPLDPCLRNFRSRNNEMLATGLRFVDHVSGRLEQAKQVKIEGFIILASEWTGTKNDFPRVLETVAKSRGFRRHSKKWSKTLVDNLQLSFGIDTGMRSAWAFQLPLEVEIIDKSAPDLVFRTWLADLLMPGFHYYRRYRSPEAAILGMQAHVDLFDTIGELMASSLERPG